MVDMETETDIEKKAMGTENRQRDRKRKETDGGKRHKDTEKRERHRVIAMCVYV
jgi:hypothetical protein